MIYYKKYNAFNRLKGKYLIYIYKIKSRKKNMSYNIEKHMTIQQETPTFIQKCEEYYKRGFTIVTCSVYTTYNKNKDKISKKPRGLPSNWQDITYDDCKEYWRPTDSIIALKAKEKVCVLDIEAAGLNKWQKWIKKNGDIETWIEKTGNDGLHYFFQPDEYFKKDHTKIGGMEMDLKPVGLVFVAGSEYKCNHTKEVKKYEWIKSPDDWKLQKMPKWLKKKIIKHTSKKKLKNPNTTLKKPNVSISIEKKEEKKLVNIDGYILQLQKIYNSFQFRKITENEDDTYYIELICNKKPCVLNGSVTHSTNNQYILFDKLTCKYSFRCHSKKCEGLEETGYLKVLDKCEFNPDIVKYLVKSITDVKTKSINMKRISDYINKHFVYIAGQSNDLYLYINYKENGRRDIVLKNSISTILRSCNTAYEYSYMVDDKLKIEKQKLKFNILYGEEGLPYRTYDKMVLDPLYNEEKNEFNTFDRFDVIKEETKEGDIEPFLNHIKMIWCKGNQEKYEYTLNWMAHLLQNPNIKTKVALVLMSKEGSGKGIIVQLLAKILGNKYYLHCTDYEKVLGNFNSQVEGKFLVFLDECVWGGNKKDTGKLKTFITEDTRLVNKKNIPHYTIKCVSNSIIASNEDWVVPAGKGARRYFILDLDNRFSGNQTADSTEYFKRIGECDIHHIAHFLYNRDITNFKTSQMPHCSALQEQKERGLNSTDSFVLSLLTEDECLCDVSDEIIEMEGWHDRKDVYESFKSYCQSVQLRLEKPHTFWRNIKKVLLYMGEKQHHKRTAKKRLVLLKSIDENKELWEKYMNGWVWE
jgi:hypothetical protein